MSAILLAYINPRLFINYSKWYLWNVPRRGDGEITLGCGVSFLLHNFAKSFLKSLISESLRDFVEAWLLIDLCANYKAYTTLRARVCVRVLSYYLFGIAETNLKTCTVVFFSRFRFSHSFSSLFPFLRVQRSFKVFKYASLFLKRILR